MAVTLHTQLGDLKVELRCDTAPRCSFNFLALAASGTYDGTPFHRLMPGFMVQGGDPAGTGKGGPIIWGGTFGDEFHPDNAHDARGVLSMANKGPDTNRSQFFLTFAPQPHLNDKYSVFGHLVDGFETLDALEKLPVGKKHRPVTEVTIDRVTIHANPFAERDPVIRSPDGAVDSTARVSIRGAQVPVLSWSVSGDGGLGRGVDGFFKAIRLLFELTVSVRTTIVVFDI